MQKTKPKKEPVDQIALWANSEVGRDFRSWWKDHRESGYATRPGTTYERWSTPPYIAWVSDRYRAEYAGDRGILAHLKFEYDAQDYERWAREQKEANDREIPTEAEFMSQLRKSLVTMGSAMKVEAAMRRPFTPAK